MGAMHSMCMFLAAALNLGRRAWADLVLLLCWVQV